MSSQSKSQKYAAWQKAEDKEARAQSRWKKFGRNCEIAKSEFIAARNQTIAAYRAYKTHWDPSMSITFSMALDDPQGRQIIDQIEDYQASNGGEQRFAWEINLLIDELFEATGYQMKKIKPENQ